MTYTIDEIEKALNEKGELLLVLDSDHYPEPVEIHIHDTTFFTDPDEILVDLSDGDFSFRPDSVESMATHLNSTSDLGL